MELVLYTGYLGMRYFDNRMRFYGNAFLIRFADYIAETDCMYQRDGLFQPKVSIIKRIRHYIRMKRYYGKARN